MFRELRCITVLNFVTIGQMVAEISVFLDFLRWQLCTILDLFVMFLTTHGTYLVVFIAGQNLAGIHAVVSII